MSVTYIDSNCAGFGRAPRTDCRLYEKQRIQVWILSHFSNSKIFINFPALVKVRRALILRNIMLILFVVDPETRARIVEKEENRQAEFCSIFDQIVFSDSPSKEILESVLPKSRIVQSKA